MAEAVEGTVITAGATCGITVVDVAARVSGIGCKPRCC